MLKGTPLAHPFREVIHQDVVHVWVGSRVSRRGWQETSWPFNSNTNFPESTWRLIFIICIMNEWAEINHSHLWLFLSPGSSWVTAGHLQARKIPGLHYKSLWFHVLSTADLLWDYSAAVFTSMLCHWAPLLWPESLLNACVTVAVLFISLGIVHSVWGAWSSHFSGSAVCDFLAVLMVLCPVMVKSPEGWDTPSSMEFMERNSFLECCRKQGSRDEGSSVPTALQQQTQGRRLLQELAEDYKAHLRSCSIHLHTETLQERSGISWYWLVCIFTCHQSAAS